MTTARIKPKAVRRLPARGLAKRIAKRKAKARFVGGDYAVNHAIRQIAAEQDPPLTAAEVAELLYVDVETVWYWMRANPSRAPKAMLALLCYQLKLKPHRLLTRGR